MTSHGKQVLVTGGAGFIGSSLTRQLIAAAHRVIVVDNLVNGRRENLSDVPDGRVRLEIEDIRDGERMLALMAGVDTVYHLACLGVRHSLHSPVENHEVNAGGSLRLLDAARRADVKRFVYVSSSEIYGTARSVPMTEDHAADPHTVYGASKLAGECYARAFFRSHGLPTVIVRPFNAFGPRCHHEGDCGEVIPKFMLRCLAGQPMIIFGDGSQTRDFSYVDDTARGIMLAGNCDAAVGETINIANGSETSVRDLAAMVAAVAGRPDTPVIQEAPRPGDVLRLYGDATKARQLLGFEPRLTLGDGLEALRLWYAETGTTPEDLLREEVTLNWRAASSGNESSPYRDFG